MKGASDQDISAWIQQSKKHFVLLSQLPVPLHCLDKEMFTKRNKTREMNVSGESG